MCRSEWILSVLKRAIPVTRCQHHWQCSASVIRVVFKKLALLESLSVCARQARRGAGVGKRRFHPGLFQPLQLWPREGDPLKETERYCPKHIFTDLHFICRFSSPLFHFFHLLSLQYQQLHNCDVMTKASVIKSQTGQGETL